MASLSRSGRTPRTARAARALGGLLLALGLAACASDGSSSQAAPAAESSTTASTPPTATDPGSPTSPASPSGTGRYASYVALGDSYTAAPLVPVTDTTSGCLRSSHNYPSLVAAALPGTQLTDVSCSGATSTSMVGVQQTGNQVQAPQFDALDEGTDLVTVGIGGNDFNLFGTLVGTCSQLRSTDPTGSPCRDKLTAGGADPLATDLDQIQQHITAIVKGIRDRSPHAEVVVVGYPQIVPAHGTCPQLLPLATGDYAYARSINKGLADALKKGAAAAKADYVDLFRATAGHDICADDPWINGAQTDPQRALAFHPFAAEQEKAAALVLAQLKK